MFDDLAVRLEVLEWVEKSCFPSNDFETNRQDSSYAMELAEVKRDLTGLHIWLPKILL